MEVPQQQSVRLHQTTGEPPQFAHMRRPPKEGIFDISPTWIIAIAALISAVAALIGAWKKDAIMVYIAKEMEKRKKKRVNHETDL